jgi:hypothetical protein
LRWRISTIADSQLHGGKDELNWLAVYLKEGPERPTVPEGFTDLTFTSYTDDFDAYFLFKEGYKTTPADRPSQPLPKPLDVLCDRISGEGAYRFTELCEHLLDLQFEERGDFAQKLSELAFRQQRGQTPGFLFKGRTAALKVICENLPADDLGAEASKLSMEVVGRAVVISLTSVPGWHVNGWASAP